MVNEKMIGVKEPFDLVIHLKHHWHLRCFDLGTRIWVACSGGRDSMALAMGLFMLQQSMGQKKWSLGIIHVNFGLRPGESDGDEDFVRNFAAKHQIPIEIHQMSRIRQAQRQGESVQAWARKERYQIFETYLKKNQVIALGHHLDDHHETILLRLSRGTSAKGLRSMQEWRDGIWRPFLTLSRKTISCWASGQKILFREDSSNAKLVYSRNRIRHKVAKELEMMYPGASSRIVRLAQEIHDVYEHVGTWLAKETLGKDYLCGKWLRGFSRGMAVEALTQFLNQQRQVSEMAVPSFDDYDGSFPRDLLYSVVNRIFDEKQRNTSWQRKLPQQDGSLTVKDDQIRYLPAKEIPFGQRWRQHRCHAGRWQSKVTLPSQSTLVMMLPRFPSTGLQVVSKASQKAVCQIRWASASDMLLLASKNGVRPSPERCWEKNGGYVFEVNEKISALIHQQTAINLELNSLVQCKITNHAPRLEGKLDEGFSE